MRSANKECVVRSIWQKMTVFQHPESANSRTVGKIAFAYINMLIYIAHVFQQAKRADHGGIRVWTGINSGADC
jgi:hypothetical protein